MDGAVHAQMFGRVACLVLVEHRIATIYVLSRSFRQPIIDADGEPVSFGTGNARGTAIRALERTFGRAGRHMPLDTIPPLGHPVYIPVSRLPGPPRRGE